MTATAAPSIDNGARLPRVDKGPSDSVFEASAFGARPGSGDPTRWIGWRRRGLVIAALLGCLALFAVARQLAALPGFAADWMIGSQGQLVLQGSGRPELNALSGQILLGLRAVNASNDPVGAEVAVDALAVHRAPRWQVDDATRQRQQAQRQVVARLLAAGPVELRFESGARLTLRPAPRGYVGLGLLFWPLAGLGLLVYLFGVVLLLARPQSASLLFVSVTLCQAANLWLVAMESSPGLGGYADLPTSSLALRVALDLCTGAASLHALVLQPRRLPHAGLIAASGWAVIPLWLWIARLDGSGGWVPLGSLWACAQFASLLLGIAALAAISVSYRLEPNPYSLVMRRFATAAVLMLTLVTVAVAVTAGDKAVGASMAESASVTWYLFLASLLLLTPTLARTRQVLREFALLAGVSTVATALDLLFVAVFSLGSYTSLAIAVFIALGLYAGARQWILNHLLGSSMLTTERTFDQLYRAAREVQARPSHYPQVLAALMRELFEPLEVLRVERVPLRARVVRGGAALVVPVRAHNEEEAPSGALALRFANRGQRLFTENDARLANRVVDQLRRAVAYDKAVERGRAEERLRIAQDLHDDIGARLLTLMYQAQSREMEDYIRHTLQDLKTLTRGLAASEHRLSHAAAEWKADLAQRLTAAHATLNWSFNFDQDVRLSVVQWSGLTRVLRELVSNALYHGHATLIEVHFTLQASELTLQVADDGAGSKPEDWAHGLGMGGVRKRVKLLGGTVAWRENEPRGIVCAVRVVDFTSPA